MSLTCTRCSRPNPRDAVFCYHDGQPLASGQATQLPPGLQRFPKALAMPSGRKCWNFDEVAQACQEEWPDAVDMLRRGRMEQFLAKLGRVDLALAAHAAASFPDADRGLDQFLARLPSQLLQPPRLQPATSEINLGTITAEGDQRVELRLANLGMRLLYGSISSDAPWLLLGDGEGASQKLFQCARETTVPVRIAIKRVRAGHQGTGRLLIDSNGGTSAVVVRLEVPAKPFAQGVLAGATTPRQLAEKARAAPKEAAPLFEDGSVARWYADNGWPFPVQGPPASGLGAVQQFFEALGLAKPPRVELAEAEIKLEGHPGQTLIYPLRLSTPDKRPLYAVGVSDQPWLIVGKAVVNGALGTLPLQVTSVPDRNGEQFLAHVTITANGGQKFVVPVTLAVESLGITAAGLVTALPVDTAVIAPLGTEQLAELPHAAVVEEYRERRPWKPLLHLFFLLPLLFLLLVLVACDVFWGKEREDKVHAQVLQDDGPALQAGKDGKVAATKAPGVAGNPKIGNRTPTYKVAVKDEPPEYNEASIPLPVKFEIIDEKEELPPVKPPQPVKVEIKDDGDSGVVAGPAGKGGAVDQKPHVAWQYGPTPLCGPESLLVEYQETAYLFHGWGHQPDSPASTTDRSASLADRQAGSWKKIPNCLPIPSARPMAAPRRSGSAARSITRRS